MVDLRAHVRSALLARDQDQLDRLAISAAIAGAPSDFERIAREELANVDEATQHWWQGPCNCHGMWN